MGAAIGFAAPFPFPLQLDVILSLVMSIGFKESIERVFDVLLVV